MQVLPQNPYRRILAKIAILLLNYSLPLKGFVALLLLYKVAINSIDRATHKMLKLIKII